MGILTNLFGLYEGYKDFQQRQKKGELDTALERLKATQAIAPGADVSDQGVLSGLAKAGVAVPQAEGQPAQPQQPVNPIRALFGGGKPQPQYAPIKAPTTPVYALDPTGKMSNLGNVPQGAAVEKLAQPKTVEYINPDTDQRVDLPYGSTPPPGFRSADIYKQDRSDDRTAKIQGDIASRQDKSIAAITDRMNNKPDTAAEDKQRRISIAQQEELGQPVSIQDKAWSKAYDKVQAKAAGQAGMVDNPNPNLTGPEALQNYTPEVQKLAKKLVNADIPYPSSFALRDPQWKAAVSAATDLDPTWNASQHKIREQTRKSFTSGPDAKNITSINTLVGHLNSLNESAKGLDNKEWQPYNTFTNWAATKTGDPRIAKFNMDLGAVESELAAVFKQTGATDQEIKAWSSRINASQSPEQLKSVIHEAVELVGSRLSALKSKYDAGMGPFGQLQILSPKSRQTLEKLVGKDAVEALEPKQEAATTGGKESGSSEASSQPPEIVNPTTGKRMRVNAAGTAWEEIK